MSMCPRKSDRTIVRVAGERREAHTVASVTCTMGMLWLFQYPTDGLFVVDMCQSITSYRPVSSTLTSVCDLFVSSLCIYHSLRGPEQRMQQHIQPFAASQTVLRLLVAVLDGFDQLRPPALGYVYMGMVVCIGACRYAVTMHARHWWQADRHLSLHQCCHWTTRTCRSMAFGCCAFTSVICGALANTQRMIVVVMYVCVMHD